jgi:hypothetical protein
MRSGSAPIIAFGGSVGFTAVMATIGMGLGRQWVQIDSLVWADTWLATFLFLLPCIAVTLTPAAIAVVVALRNAPAGSRERRNWQIAAAGLAVSVLITLVYHLPTNIRIWTGDFTADEATTELHRWLLLHAVRTLAGLAAVIASYQAITAAHDQPSAPESTTTAG